MELSNAIVKMEQGGSVDGLLQVNFIRRIRGIYMGFILLC